MKRLRELGLKIGMWPPGRHNAITDVEGVGVGQVEVAEDGLYTGITAVVPYPAGVKERQLFVGRWALDGGAGMTGLGVAEDFGTFSTPIVLGPAAAVGKIYDALIQYGLGRDPGLSTVAGWPPIVVGVDDSGWNPPARIYARVGEPELFQALKAVRNGRVNEGNAGIGCGLSAFGFKGGTGTASRVLATGAGTRYTVGVLVAANAGALEGLCVDRYPVGGRVQPQTADLVGPRTFAAVLATDAPLVPRQLDRLSGRAAPGLSRVGLLDGATREGVVLAFSTTGIVQQEEEGGVEEKVRMEDEVVLVEEKVRMEDEAVLHELFAAAGEACEEAVLNALLAAAPVQKSGRVLGVLPLGEWVDEVRRYQQEKSR
jgi:D-aminopeptidase